MLTARATNTMKNVHSNHGLTYLPACWLGHRTPHFRKKALEKRVCLVAKYFLSPGGVPREERLTAGGAVLPHDALHRGDDLLHHGRRQRRGVHSAVRMCSQVVYQLLGDSQKQVIRGDAGKHWQCRCLPAGERRSSLRRPWNGDSNLRGHTVKAHCQPMRQTHGNVLRLLAFVFQTCHNMERWDTGFKEDLWIWRMYHLVL